MSPSYPSPYPAKTTCRYEFQGRGKERVQIVFQDFNLYHPTSDDPKDCENADSLNAFVHIDGRMEKIESFCGAVLPKPVMSNGPRLKLEFQSRLASRYSRGFKATYSFTENFGINTGVQLPDYPCAFVFNSNDPETDTFTVQTIQVYTRGTPNAITFSMEISRKRSICISVLRRGRSCTVSIQVTKTCIL
nr:unnamed protein product [Callosobruchus analis]